MTSHPGPTVHGDPAVAQSALFQSPSSATNAYVVLEAGAVSLDFLIASARDYASKKSKDFVKSRPATIFIDNKTPGRSVVIIFEEDLGTPFWRVSFNTRAKVSDYEVGITHDEVGAPVKGAHLGTGKDSQ